MESLKNRLNTHRLHYAVLLCIVVVAATLRFHLLTTHAIFFADMGRDFLVAQQALDAKELPLVGIASSRPYLHQGPLSIWLTMLVFSVTSSSAPAAAFVFAFLGFLAVVLLYELLVTTVSNRAALLGAAVYTVSPLIVAQSRMAYHTSLELITTVCYLWAVVLLAKGFTVRRLVIALIAAVFLLQSALSTVPLLLLIPYVFWKKKYRLSPKRLKQVALVVIVCLILGTAPQLLAELTGQSHQLTGLLTAIITKISNLQTVNGSRQFWTGDHSFLLYLRHTFGLTLIPQLLGLLLFVFGAGAVIRSWKARQLPITVELAAVSIVLLCSIFIVTRNISEAYWPPVATAIAIVCAYGVAARTKSARVVVYATATLLCIITTMQTVQSKYFTEPKYSLIYDAVGEHRAIAQFIQADAQSDVIYITSSKELLAAAPTYVTGIQFFLKTAGQTSVIPSSSAERAYLLLPLTDTPPAGTFVLARFTTKQLLVRPAQVSL